MANGIPAYQPATWPSSLTIVPGQNPLVNGYVPAGAQAQFQALAGGSGFAFTAPITPFLLPNAAFQIAPGSNLGVVYSAYVPGATTSSAQLVQLF